MKFIDKLERKFGRFGVPNLTVYIIGCYVLGYFLAMFAPGVLNMLSLDMSMVCLLYTSRPCRKEDCWQILCRRYMTGILLERNFQSFFLVEKRYLSRGQKRVMKSSPHFLHRQALWSRMFRPIRLFTKRASSSMRRRNLKQDRSAVRCLQVPPL